MISQNALEIERSIRRLSLEEQQWLLKQISQQVRSRARARDLFADRSYLEEQIKEMAKDPDIQAEIAAINREESCD